ncbi:MAG: glycosyltransferase family 2 protein [Bacteroidota bacterium]
MSSQTKNPPQARVSVAMCTYNGEDFLDEQIQSILNQSYQNIELIIVDDCSTDNTFAILENWKARFPTKFSIYRNEVNLGYNKNFEKAILLSNGDFIAIADQDDIWEKEKIAKLVNAFDAENVILTHCASVHLRDNKLLFKSGELKWENHFSGNDTRTLYFFNKVQGHNMLFRQSLKSYILPIPKDFFYDWWIAVIATCKGEIKSVPEYLVKHRLHGKNAYYESFTLTKVEEKKEILKALENFSSIDCIREVDKQLLVQMITQLRKHLNNFKGGIDFKFFKFLFIHRWLIFSHKKRVFPEWTLFKSSIKYARK